MYVAICRLDNKNYKVNYRVVAKLVECGAYMYVAIELVSHVSDEEICEE